MSIPIENRRKQLLYRAHYRGFREADLIIGGFAKDNIPEMTETELDEFEALLELNDHDLYNWLMDKGEPPANVKGAIFDRLKEYDVAKVTAPRKTPSRP